MFAAGKQHHSIASSTGQRRNLGKAGECGASVSGAGSGRADEEITGEPEFPAVASLIVVDYWTKLML